MNKSIDCEVVKDLLPLYYDKVVSLKTEALIKEHLDTCRDCNAEYEKMFGELPIEGDADFTKDKFIDTMKKQKTKNIIKIFVSVILVLFIVLGGCVVDHYLGDNIYASFVFSDAKVVAVGKNTYRVPKDNTDVFNEYMIEQGWRLEMQLGSVFIFENKYARAECTLVPKRYYCQVNVKYVDKIKPSSELISIYGKSLYNCECKDGMIVYTDPHFTPNYTVAWYQHDYLKMENAKLVVENGDEVIYSKAIDMNIIEDKKKYIRGGWNGYVLLKKSFSVPCENPTSPKAYIIFTDNNDVEYRVCLDPTEKDNNDAGNDVIITDQNATYSYDDYLDDQYWDDDI